MKGTATYLTNSTSKKVLCCIFGVLHSLNYSKYIGISGYFDIFSDESRYFGGRPISARALEGAVMPPINPGQNPGGGTGGKAPRSCKNLVL